ncbi:MAG TPA: tetratricopeptide repeat protein [Oceanipulchritudo sp.]|nr:tetratricopeptide repeat protein [Oceanipulchritudo sp.]
MVKRLYRPLRLLLVLLPTALLTLLLEAQEADGISGPLVPQSDNTEQQTARLRTKWELEGITTAIQSGFLAVADTLTRQMLDKGDLSSEMLADLYNYRLHISLVRGELEEARTVLSTMEEKGWSPNPLLEAFFRFFDGDLQTASERLSSLERFNLSPDDRAWSHLLEALILNRSGRTEAANEAFLVAERLAPTSLLRDQLEIIRYREELANGSYDDATISALRESVRSMRGERGGFEAARLLAVALNRAGDPAAAIEVLNTHLTLPGLREFNLRPDFLLLLGTIAGPGTPRGRLALEEIVSEDRNPARQSVALTLIAQSISSVPEKDSFLRNINAWLNQAPPHPLSDRLLAFRAFFLADNRSFTEAEASARLLVEQYPASPFVPDALRMLAYTSWNQTPPRYRTAADYLNRLRQRLPNSKEAFEAGVLIADCYFLNGDFASASDAYGAMLRDASVQEANSIFFQRILAEIGADRPSIAAELIDAARSDPRLTSEILWKADWNLIDYLRRNLRTVEAYQRIQKILEPAGEGTKPLSTAMRLRFRWLEARLTLEAGPPQEAVSMATILLQELGEGKFQDLPVDQLAEVESHLLLLKGEAEITSGQKSAGLATFSSLRDKFSRSGQAILSYLVESRSESDADNLVSAQQSLVALVDRFPTSEYAPIALWEAALNAEQRGLNIHLQEAIGILERLVNEYPSHELVYYARLKQGDLARRLNDFPTALLLYERILSQFPDHPERFRAEISRADCLMALGSEDPARFDMAAVIYERNCLLPTAPLPVRMEAGFKWAHALTQQGEKQDSEVVYWLLFERFILDKDMGQAIIHDEAGRYWVARVLLELGTLQSDKGEIAAARQIYETHLQMNLPGAALAQTRLDSLR